MQEDITGLAEFFYTLSQLAHERPRSRGELAAASQDHASLASAACTACISVLTSKQIREECRDIVGSDKRLDWVDRASAY